MHIPKKVAIGMATAAIASTALVGGTAAFAQSSTDASGDTLVDKIATKFNLNKSEVQAVFEQDRQEKQADREAEWQERIDAAVESGELTEAQAKLITDKRAELKANFEKNKPVDPSSETDAQRQAHRTQMQAQRQELQQWATDNGIELRWLLGFGSPGGHGGPRGDGQPPFDALANTIQQ